ncbi:hypothetical protein K8352_14390 [Flavobacteriaceae bacterium F89]|uniref:DUF4190 domain-containing protein n=1 Tax=Cerina litoralis TaxID=2874477 RepID=A0AAE3EVR9_9FLAO|nr:CCC motif membrane protein [Cerina litoralis]MCG2461945.1 hypothetical protein [Cerina litoralis]
MNQRPLPGASTVLTMGIIALIGSLTCCGPFAAIFSIIGLVQAKEAEKVYQEEPADYTGYENVRTGRILAYIGLAISIVLLLLSMLYFGVIVALLTSGEFS